MQKLGETLSAGCGFTIEELQDAERAFAAAGAKVRIFCPSLTNIFTQYSPQHPVSLSLAV
jgi:hypothetical protein